MVKVTIIVPVYNVEAYIEECITSIMAQDFKSLEVLIINDCTQDKSIEIAQKIISEYNGPHRYRIINLEKNSGVSAARNRGLYEASGSLIYYLDSDDSICKGAITNLVEIQNKTNVDIVIGNLKVIDYLTKKPAKSPIDLYKNFYIFKSLEDLYSCPKVLSMDFNGIAWNKLIKKDFLIKNNILFDEGILFEDDIWGYKVYCNKPTMAVSNQITYIYKIRPNSVMTTFTEKHLYSAVKCADIAISYGLNRNEKNWFTLDKIEKYINGALYKSFDKVSNIYIYKKLYRRFKNKYKPSLNFWTNANIPLPTKIKSIHYLLPTFLGEKYLLFFFKIQQNKMRKIYPRQSSIPSIKLDDTFGDNI